MSKNILILSTGDNHGAYEAAYKLAKFLYDAKYTVALLVRQRTKSDPFIFLVKTSAQSVYKRIANKILVKSGLKKEVELFKTESKYSFFTQDENVEFVSAGAILNTISFIPDLIIGGMTNGFCTTNTLSQLRQLTNAKIYVWLVDMEPLTGGCHYAWDCKGYEQECKNCPAILDASQKDQASINLKVKLENVLKSNIRVLSGSHWVTEQAKRSLLFRNQKLIRNTHACIDTRILNGNNRDIAKRVFGIEENAKIIFTGSWNINDARKGLQYFYTALRYLWDLVDSDLKEKVFILVAGEHYGKRDFLKEVPFKIMHVDYIKDYRLLSLAYQAADIFVCSSIEDSGPMMVSEALACGTPVVGFRMGNVYSMVENDVNGYVAELRNSKDLAVGINKILSLSKMEFDRYSKNAIGKVEAVASHHAAVRVIEALFEDN